MLLRRAASFTLICLLLSIGEARAEEKKAAAKPADSNPAGKVADSAAKRKQQEEYYDLLKLFADTLDQVDRNYVNSISRRELMEAAIEGMLKKLDQYSNYIPPKELDRFRTGIENEFGGIGIRISLERGFLEVIGPLYGTPAYKAGVLAGDRIVRIDGKSTNDFNIDQVVKLLKGRVGTDVQLSVVHPGEKRPSDIVVKRAMVRVETVLGYRRKADDSWDYYCDRDRRIGYVMLTAFGKNTAHELRRVLTQLKGEGLRGLIVDVRSNPGGLLSSAIQISDMFVAEGLIVATEGRNAPRNEWKAHRRGTLLGFPMAVLTNRFSASGSEILAACLRDHGRAIVVGERTWGKGSVQNIIELEGGRSALKLTTASYQRPNGKNIHRFENATEADDWGVRPSDGYAVRFSNREIRRLEALRRELGIVDRRKSKEIGESFDDRQFNKALKYVLEAVEKKAKGGGAAQPKKSGKPDGQRGEQGSR